MNDRRFAARGFTLVEMLVSLALVALLMSMFGQVFQIAGGAVSTQRGLMENDQRARTLQTILKADLDKRTFRWVVPFWPGEDVNGPEARLGERRGYIYISENDPFDDTDDKLQFTVDMALTTFNKDDSSNFGRAAVVPGTTLNTKPNQPESDDGWAGVNSTGSSRKAEVVYFLRNGNLYRRMQLLRDPISLAGDDPQPKDETGRTFFALPGMQPTAGLTPLSLYPSANVFWREFDYSAQLSFATPPLGGPVQAFGARFFGVASLDNDKGSLASISYPPNRFGFEIQRPDYPAGWGGQDKLHPSGGNRPNWVGGRSKEFVGETYIGAYMMEETSAAGFLYPMTSDSDPSTQDDPTDPAFNPGIAASPNPTLAMAGFVGGTRRGEDLVLPNVHAFDVDVWDETANAFVDIGYDDAGGLVTDYSRGARYNQWYGPRVPARGGIFYPPPAATAPAGNNVFDTWYVDAATTDASGLPGAPLYRNIPAASATTPPTTIDFSENLVLDAAATAMHPAPEVLAPYRPTRLRPIEFDVAGVLVPAPAEWPAVPVGTERNVYLPGTSYQAGDIVFPHGDVRAPGAPLFYRCIRSENPVGTVAAVTTDATPPDSSFWPRVAGLNTAEDFQTTGGLLQWQAVENRKPMRGIRITVRFLDPSTRQLRNLSIVHSLIDHPE